MLIPTQAHIRNLNAARLAADVCGVPTLIVARTDAESAKLITSDIDERDRPFLTGERTPEGFFRLKDGTGLDHCIARGLAFAPHADVLWWETSHSTSACGVKASPRAMQWSSPVPPSSGRTPRACARRSGRAQPRSSISDVISLALSASVRATIKHQHPGRRAAPRSSCGYAPRSEMAGLPAKVPHTSYRNGPPRPHLDIGLVILKHERPAEPGLGIGDDRHKAGPSTVPRPR